MMKNSFRITLGLMLLLLAHHLHREGINWANRSVGVWIEGDPLPPAREYFGPDPYEYVKTPESKAQAAKGDLYARVAYLSQGASYVLILLGTAPYFFIILGWLFIPDAIRERARLAQTPTETQTPDHPEPEQETPCDTAEPS